MKATRILSIAAICGIIGLNSCVKDMDIMQESKITASNMWQTESDATGAMYGMFHQFRAAFQTALIYWGDYRAGTFTDGLGTGTCSKMYLNQLDATESKGTNWGSTYTLINNANLILKHVPSISFNDPQMKNQVLASAYFVRAYAYYNVARVWGDAPLLTSGFESDKDDIHPFRQEESRIYSQVESDLKQAIELMPSGIKDCTIANPAAIQMLKADYNLWTYQTRFKDTKYLDAAEEALDAVFANTAFSLEDSYSTVFDINSKNNKEIILTLHMEKGEYEGGYSTSYLIPTHRYFSSSEHIEKDVKVMNDDDQRYMFSKKVLELLHADENDSRRPVCYGNWTDSDTGTTYTWINKFAGLWQDNVRYFVADEPLYRYAEAIMWKAEIQNERGQGEQALTYLNKIAKRAYGVDNYYSGTDYYTIKENLCDEYLKEFCAEGKSWWVYIRLGYAFTKIETLRGRQNETNILLWPIASACLNENPNMRQTLGYK